MAGILNFIPSVVWLLLIILPLCFGFTAQNPAVLRLQALGASLMAGFIVLADWLAARLQTQKRVEVCSVHPQTAKYFIPAGLGILSFIFLLKVLVPGKVPLVEFLTGESAPEIAKIRNIFEGGFGGWWGARILNSFPLLIGLPLLALFIKTKRWVNFLFTSFYTLLILSLSTAKGPVLLYIISVLILISLFVKQKNVILILFCLVSLIFSAFVWVWVQSAVRPHKKYFQVAQTNSTILSLDLSDVTRAGVEKGIIQRTPFSYLSYRIFLVPVCVAYRWYEFTRLPSFEKEIRKSEAKSPANLIGRWAYFERFPKDYLPEVRAYASIDADAFYRGGFLGVVAAGFIYLLSRILLQQACQGNCPILLGLKALGLSIYIYVPIQGSIQAMLGSQGLLFIISLGFLIKKFFRAKWVV